MTDEANASQQGEGEAPPSAVLEATEQLRVAMRALHLFADAMRQRSHDLRQRGVAAGLAMQRGSAARALTPVERRAKQAKRKASKAGRKNNRKGKK
ncbi:hypothetical protein PBI_SUZY_75 [Gordonia phage Suzy]|uniref:Uncharacterized protein n=1 Tax=Gordonia phage Suzy TaxID=2201430 RepID=A0A2Z4Q8S3_9CAUD|nr:hypothetical protein HOT44_gp75 [Gordonia phage Suzy]AWY06179.1 hypothetical protein PBI_SUZY_75 [Gordonia phage Suzy]